MMVLWTDRSNIETYVVELSKVKPFWRMVEKSTKKILGILIPCSLRIYVLHDLAVLEVSKPRKLLLLNLSLAASLLLAATWKSEIIPSRDDWLAKV